MATFHVQRQPWQRWPRTLVCVKTNDDGTTEERKYVPEDKDDHQRKAELNRRMQANNDLVKQNMLLSEQVEKRDVLIRALWCRILSEYPQGGFPDMGMFEDELKWMGVI